MKKIVTDETGQPVVGAVLFAPDNQGVDVTDSSGNIKIEQVKPGQYYFKMLGFEDFYFEPDSSPETLVLKSKSYELGEVTVTGKKSRAAYIALFLIILVLIYKYL
jgi:hypothetical protein